MDSQYFVLSLVHICLSWAIYLVLSGPLERQWKRNGVAESEIVDGLKDYASIIIALLSITSIIILVFNRNYWIVMANCLLVILAIRHWIKNKLNNEFKDHKKDHPNIVKAKIAKFLSVIFLLSLLLGLCQIFEHGCVRSSSESMVCFISLLGFLFSCCFLIKYQKTREYFEEKAHEFVCDELLGKFKMGKSVSPIDIDKFREYMIFSGNIRIIYTHGKLEKMYIRDRLTRAD